MQLSKLFTLAPFMECFGSYVKFWHLWLKQKDKSIEWKTKGQAKSLNINVLWYNRFVFRHWLPFLWEKTGSICLGIVAVMAGWLAGRWNAGGDWNFKNSLQVKIFINNVMS